jgi:hypothetical protein
MRRPTEEELQALAGHYLTSEPKSDPEAVGPDFDYPEPPLRSFAERLWWVVRAAIGVAALLGILYAWSLMGASR